jgi:ParB family chromosome partitioning protein
MSVTESKVTKTKKNARKSAETAGSDALNTALAQTVVQQVPLSALVKSPLNVRTIAYLPERVAGLADTIAKLGLLHNLIVHALPDGTFGVAAGGRRLAAMHLLVERGIYTLSEAVAVKIVPEELAVAASSAENFQRVDMHPAEQIIAFRSLAEEGKTAVQIGDLLGFGSRHVQRMLKLAGLAPAILDALAKDELTTDHCHSLALENDQYRQLEVLEAATEKNGGRTPSIYDIRRLITDSEVSTDCSKFRFVGAEAFRDGEIRCDLFSEEEGGYVSAELLNNRVLQKLQTLAETMKQTEGWSWCLGRMSQIAYYGDDKNLYDALPAPEPEVEYTQEEQEKLDALKEQYDSFDCRCDESDALDAEIAAIEEVAEVRAWSPERKATQGVVVSWDGGEICIQRGVLLKEQKEAETQGEEATQKVVAYKRVPEPEPALIDAISLPLLTKMSSERTLAVQAAAMQQTAKSVALLAWTLCKSVFTSGSTGANPLQVRLDCSQYSLCENAPSGKEGAAYLAMMQEKNRLAALLPRGWEKDFTHFFTLDAAVLMSLLGFCVASGINGVQTREYGRTSSSCLDALESALNFNMRDWWQPTKDNFFGLLSKTQIADALNDAGATSAAGDIDKMKKGDAAAVAENRMADNRWVPVWMQGPQPQEPENPDALDTENNHTAHAA